MPALEPCEGTARLPPGTRLNGLFEIDRHLAVGGMGEIYQGHTIETGDAVAIKVIRADLADGDLVHALFRREAQALHSINHEAIIRYYVFGHDPGIRRNYLAMEFVDGPPLSDILKRGPLAFDQIQLLRRRLASALHEAHRHGIIHRDVSPDNVLVPDGDVGRAKIIDFGVARSVRAGQNTSILGGGFAGKYNYVSPEQLGMFDGEVTAQSDIYSFGIVLAECLLGRSMDMGGSHLEVIEKRRVVPDLTSVDPRLRPLLVRMLQPDPKDRPESMAEVAAWRLDAAAGEEADAAFAAASRGQHRFTPDEATDTAPQWKAAPRSRHARAASLLTVLAGAILTILPNSIGPEEAGAYTKERIVRFVKAYNGGDCFFVKPKTVKDKQIGFVGYGASIESFRKLDAEIIRRFGFEATVEFGPVTTAQCAALRFLSRIDNQSGPSPQLDIDVANLKGTVAVTGSVANVQGGNVELLLVEHDGAIRNLTGQLEAGRNEKSFKFSFPHADGGPAQPYLLCAVVSDTPLAALQSRGTADQVFARAMAEAVKTRQALKVGVTYFKLQK